MRRLLHQHYARVVLLLLSAVLALVQSQTVIHSTVQCSSPLITDGFSTPITDVLSLHWKLTSEGNLSAIVEYLGSGWVGLGFSDSGDMVHSTAVIGSKDGGVQLYDLSAQTIAGVQPVDQDTAALANVVGDFEQESGKSILGFDMKMLPEYTSENGLYKMIIAAGNTDAIGFHRHREPFRINLNSCTTDADTSSGEIPLPSSAEYNHKAAFGAHAFFAVFTFAVIIPLAVGAALYRVLIPKWWIYVHVMSNSFAFLFATIAVGCGFGGVVMRSNAGGSDTHFVKTHHWMGLIIYLLLIFQVANGFRRPPVEAKMDAMMIMTSTGPNDFPEPKRCGGSTVRERWHFLHRCTAITMIILALFQMQSGIDLYTSQYGTDRTATLTVYWVWIGLLALFFLCGKLYLIRRERRKLRGTASANRNIMPQNREDDDLGGLGSSSSSISSGGRVGGPEFSVV